MTFLGVFVKKIYTSFYTIAVNCCHCLFHSCELLNKIEDRLCTESGIVEVGCGVRCNSPRPIFLRSLLSTVSSYATYNMLSCAIIRNMWC